MALNFDYTSIFLIFINLFVFVLFIFLTFVIIRQYKNSSNDEEALIRDRTFKNAIQMLEDAQHNSLNIIKDTTLKSAELIHSAEYISEDSKNILKSELKSLFDAQLAVITASSNEIQDLYKKAVSDEEKKSLEVIKHISHDIEDTALKSVTDFNVISASRIEDFEKNLATMLQDELKSSRERIMTYEAALYKDINTKSKKVISSVVKNVFGKSISIEIQEDLVISALEKALAQEMFS